MIPMNGSSFGRAGGLLRRYPGGTENASILATVRGSIPNRRAASRSAHPLNLNRIAEPAHTAPRPSSPALCRLTAKGYPAAGFLLRRNRTTRPLQ